ncbi:hypothetical protein SAY86_007999 [Trapa natans]|uniref:UBC core domain-containing protein n=1 Tax=Trapa natans TaxID=22666 RepID=A0AAN7LMA1_TRANT|nr:hypothetical protein SAY86_007999 [Trapa natans]
MGTGLQGAASEVDLPTTDGHDMTLEQKSSVPSEYCHGSSLDMQRKDGDKPNVGSRSHSSVPIFYAEDVVRSKSSNMIGIVSEVAGDLDSDSGCFDDDDDDDDDDDEEDDNEYDAKDGDDAEGDINDKPKDNHNDHVVSDKPGPLSVEQVRVLWINGTETTEDHSNLTVADRGFLHGDYVTASSVPTGQIGVVVDVNIMVDLAAPDGSTTKNISSRDLKRVREFTIGDYVIFGPWLGRIDDVVDNVTVKVDDGSVCKVMKADPLLLKPITKNILEDGHYPYYPGQRVKATSSSVFKNSRWLSGLWKATKLEGTVIKVTVGSVFVYWITSAGYGPSSSIAPAEKQSPKNLKLVSCFDYADWELGDWCLLRSSLSSSAPPYKGLSKSEIDDSTTSDSGSFQPGTACDSEETVLDQSNDHEVMDVDPVSSLDVISAITAPSESSSCTSSLSSVKEPVHESWPYRKKLRKVVVKRDKKTRKKEESFKRAFQIVDIRTTVDVLWQDGMIEHGLISTELMPVETPGDHDFVAEQYVVEKTADDEDCNGEPHRVGVVRSVNAKERTACVNWLKPVAKAEDPREFDKEEIVSVYELEGHPDYDYCYGDVVVRLSTMTAQKIVSEDYMETTSKFIESNEGSADTEKSNEGEDASGDEGCMGFSCFSWVGNITGLKNGDIEVTWADGTVSTVGPQAIYVVGRGDDDGSLSDESELSDVASWETVEDNDMDTHEDEQKKEQGQQSGSDTNSTMENAENNSGSNSALSLPFAALGFVTRLASGIFSRGRRNSDSINSDSEGEKHMHSEPIIKHSMETCPGDGVDSEKSNILCIADSVVADESEEECVSATAPLSSDGAESLNDRSQDLGALASNKDAGSSFKHFDVSNEPFDHYFHSTDAQSNNSRKWLRKVHQDWDILHSNLPDDIYVRVYEDRMDLLRAVIVGACGTPYQDGLFFFDFHLSPEYPDVPPDFGDLVKEHFRKRGYYILKACDAYMKGYLIGSLAKDASIVSESNANSTSVGFKLMLAKIVPKLLLAMEEVGVDCHEFEHFRNT